MELFGSLTAALRTTRGGNVMFSASKTWLPRGTVIVLVCLANECFADVPAPLSPTNTFAPASEPAHSPFELFLFVLAVIRLFSELEEREDQQEKRNQEDCRANGEHEKG